MAILEADGEASVRGAGPGSCLSEKAVIGQDRFPDILPCKTGSSSPQLAKLQGHLFEVIRRNICSRRST
jgi:hypothetical protein